MQHLSLSSEVRHQQERVEDGSSTFLRESQNDTRGHDWGLKKKVEEQDKLSQAIDKFTRREDLLTNGSSPSWSILVHKEPSFTDESPLITNHFFASSKLEQTQGIQVNMRMPTSSKRCEKPVTCNGRLYYRPNRTHQFLSSTDLRNCTQDEVNIHHGRPTRATLLRARQQKEASSAVLYQTRREFLHRLDEIRNSWQTNPRTEYFHLEKILDGEPVHSFLTGARYNRYNPALGCFFTEARGKEFQKSEECPPLDMSRQPPSSAYRSPVRPATVPSHLPRNAPGQRQQTRSADHIQGTPLSLKVTGSNLPVCQIKDPIVKLPSLKVGPPMSEEGVRVPADDAPGTEPTTSASHNVSTENGLQTVSETRSTEVQGHGEAVNEVASQMLGLDVKKVEADDISSTTQTSVSLPAGGVLPVTMVSVSVISDTEVSLVVPDNTAREVKEGDVVSGEIGLNNFQGDDTSTLNNCQGDDIHDLNILQDDDTLGQNNFQGYDTSDLSNFQVDDTSTLNNFQGDDSHEDENYGMTHHELDRDKFVISENENTDNKEFENSDSEDNDFIFLDINATQDTKHHREDVGGRVSEEEAVITGSGVKEMLEVESDRSQNDDVAFFVTEEEMDASSTPVVGNQKQGLGYDDCDDENSFLETNTD